jgi:hypothetical protein
MSSMAPERPAGKGKGKPKKQDQDFKPLSREEIARLFGQSYVIMEQDEGLKNWFLDFARRYNESLGKISKERFMLELEQQPWWIKNSETYITDLQQELENPTDYKQAIAGDVANLKASAARIGATGIDNALFEKLVKDQRRLGWNEQQTLERLVEFITPAEGGDFRGIAGVTQNTLNQWARANGLTLSPTMVQDYVRRVASGSTTIDDVKDDLRRTYLKGAFPAWADRIEQGMDPADIAAPYKAKMAALLELDENVIDFNDSLLQKAMQGVGADGKPIVVPLYDFEREIRNDPRWQKTDNAYQTYTNVGQDLLRMFGFR